MSDEDADPGLTDDERGEIHRRAAHLHMDAGLGGAFPIGPFMVDYVQNVGVWVYCKGLLIYGDNIPNEHADFDDPETARELLRALRCAMILDDLADA